MSTGTATLVTVCAMESGPAGPGRPVEVEGEVIGIAEAPVEVFTLVEAAGITGPVDLVWADDDPGAWD